MGRMKEFGTFIANCVYKDRMSNDDILSSIESVYGLPEDKAWVQQQIATVRKYPKLYAPLVARWDIEQIQKALDELGMPEEEEWQVVIAAHTKDDVYTAQIWGWCNTDDLEKTCESAKRYTEEEDNYKDSAVYVYSLKTPWEAAFEDSMDAIQDKHETEN